MKNRIGDAIEAALAAIIVLAMLALAAVAYRAATGPGSEVEQRNKERMEMFMRAIK